MESTSRSNAVEDDKVEEIEGDGYCSPQESESSNIILSPGGTSYCTPDVPKEIKPFVGIVYNSLEDAIEAYKKYAEMAGFDIRLSTKIKGKDDKITWRYVLCNRASDGVRKSGDSTETNSSDKKRRKTCIKVTGCEACIRFKAMPDMVRFKVYHFVERHNHMMVEQENKDLLRMRRQLDLSDYNFIHRASSSNIGATKAHKLRSMLKGGYGHATGTVAEYKNAQRDLNGYLGPRDGQCIIDKLNNRKLYVPNFSFEYQLDGTKLISLFWADETSKLNYIEFGDIISFDATFRTNKYKMIFVPFTGIDNHKKSVTFGAGLLNDETFESYKWLLEAFLRSHHKQPKIVLSDQDAALGQAISTVFTDSRHRLCMWHIMTKLNTKLGVNVLNTGDFRKKINKLVWNDSIEPEEFERQWVALIDEYNFQDNGWLSQMFEIRSTWISAYFKDVPMSGLMKTTSRSESANSFFRTFLHDGDTFLNFMSCFDAAMEKQRYIQRSNDHTTRTTKPKLVTPSQIEYNASNVYTHAVFEDVQKEIYKAAWFCYQKCTVSEDNCEVVTVIHKCKNSEIKKEFKVVLHLSGPSVVCTCNHFGRHGIFCRHIFTVLMNYGIHEIPAHYALRRWQRDLLPANVLRRTYLDFDEEFERKSNKAHSIIFDCMDLLRDDKEKLDIFLDDISKMKEKIESGMQRKSGISTKKNVIESLLGVRAPESIEINVPTGIRNKGCGVGKRLIGAGEKALKKNSKGYRMCRTCRKYIDHDSRTCPNRVKKDS